MSKLSNLKKLLNMTRDEAREIHILSKERRMLLDCVENLNDFKSNVQYYANFCACIERQLHNTVKYYHGSPYFLDKTDINLIMIAVRSMCKHVGYELYSPNGSWFVRSIK